LTRHNRRVAFADLSKSPIRAPSQTASKILLRRISAGCRRSSSDPPLLLSLQCAPRGVSLLAASGFISISTCRETAPRAIRIAWPLAVSLPAHSGGAKTLRSACPCWRKRRWGSLPARREAECGFCAGAKRRVSLTLRCMSLARVDSTQDTPPLR